MKKLIGFSSTLGSMNRRNRARMMINGIVLLLTIWLVLPSLKEAFVLNQGAKRILSAITLSNDGAKYWYAAGLPAVTGEELKALIIRTYNFSLTQGICTDPEKRIWQEFPYPIYLQPDGQSNDTLEVLLQARGLECDGRLSEAAGLLDTNSKNNIILLKKVDLLRRVGQNEAAFSIAISSVCPSNAEWCKWCMAKTWQLGSYADSGTQYLSNSSPEDPLQIDMQTIGPLQKIANPNVMIETEVPLVVTGVLPLSKFDNYLAYTIVPTLGSKVRFRVWGVVVGENISSRLSPRLVFWSEGKYIGEDMGGYNVTGKFSVDFWDSLPSTTDAVTPYITFGNLSFAGGQKIAICATELAIAP